MKDEIDAGHGRREAVGLADIADDELELGALVGQPHVLLFLLVPGENADLPDVGLEEAAEDGIAERPRSAGDEENLVFKHGRIISP